MWRGDTFGRYISTIFSFERRNRKLENREFLPCTEVIFPLCDVPKTSKNAMNSIWAGTSSVGRDTTRERFAKQITGPAEIRKIDERWHFGPGDVLADGAAAASRRSHRSIHSHSPFRWHGPLSSSNLLPSSCSFFSFSLLPWQPATLHLAPIIAVLSTYALVVSPSSFPLLSLRSP